MVSRCVESVKLRRCNDDRFVQAGSIRWPCLPMHLRDALESNFVSDRAALKRHNRMQALFIRRQVFVSVALCRYWTFFDADVVIDNIANESIPHNSTNETTISCHAHDVLFIKTYLIGVNGIVALNLPLLLLMIYHSARGSITDTHARRFVAPLLYVKWVASSELALLRAINMSLLFSLSEFFWFSLRRHWT